MHSIDTAERRLRLAVRHRLAPGRRAADVVEAAGSVVCLHATDPATVYLSAWARVEGMQIADMDRALYDDRSLVKHLAMRRTLFVFPRDVLAVAQAAASAKVADAERKRLIRDVEKAGLRRDAKRWLTQASNRVLAALEGGREATSTELRDEIPLLEGSLTYGEGKSWGGSVPVGPRVLTTLSAAGRIVRATNNGGWASSRPRWAAMESWLGEALPQLDEREATAALVGRWLGAFGPGTEADIKWWLGSTLGAVRRALADLDATEVDLGGATGHVLPGDLDPVGEIEPWAALLPPLDPTTMGWQHRDWYLGPHKTHVFDRAGNAGATVWWDGRIVGGWLLDEDGAVALQMLEDVGADALRAIEAEAQRLTAWLEGTRFVPRFPSPLSKRGVSARDVP